MNRDFLVDRHSLPFRFKVQWFSDLLAHPEARRHLWSLYYTGEAYEEIHPVGVFVDMLEPGLGRVLARHLSDETRHAAIFRSVAAAEATVPSPVDEGEDVGWHLLTHIVPDVVESGRTRTPFTVEQTIRYMAFLHTLELRSISDLGALIEAARARGEAHLVRALEPILKDELFHASYTHAAVYRLSATAEEAARILDRSRRQERRYYNVVLNNILRHFERLDAQPRTFGARLRWRVMALVARAGLAVPLLPLYRQVPRRVWSDAPAY